MIQPSPISANTHDFTDEPDGMEPSPSGDGFGPQDGFSATESPHPAVPQRAPAPEAWAATGGV